MIYNPYNNMKSKEKIVRALVLGAGGNVSQGIIKALREAELPLRIIGACISEYSKGLYMCDEGYICPYAADDEFIPWVVNFCNKHSIDIIYTGVEENIIKLALFEDVIRNQTGAVFVSSSYEQLKTGEDKYLTCVFLEKAGCNYPKYQMWSNPDNAKTFAKSTGYPVIAKPVRGKGSRGIIVVNNPEEFDRLEGITDYILEECVGDADSEYTVGCYVDKNGSIQAMLPMQRKLFNGTTVWAKTLEDEVLRQRIISECKGICQAFKPKGPLNIQLRIDKSGRPVCFELNVRFSGTTAIRAHFGFKDVKAEILEYVYDVDIKDCFNIKSGEVFRYDEEIYLSHDATETMKNKYKIEEIADYVIEHGCMIK